MNRNLNPQEFGLIPGRLRDAADMTRLTADEAYRSFEGDASERFDRARSLEGDTTLPGRIDALSARLEGNAAVRAGVQAHSTELGEATRQERVAAWAEGAYPEMALNEVGTGHSDSIISDSIALRGEHRGVGRRMIFPRRGMN